MARALLPTETLKFTEARPHLSELLNRVFRHEARIVIAKGSIPVAALVSLDDLERLIRLDAERDADLRIFDEVGRAFADQSPEEIERGVNQSVAAVRAEAGAAREAALPQ